MNTRDLTVELINAKEKPQFYPFSKGEIIRRLVCGNRFNFLKTSITSDLGLSACNIDTKPSLACDFIDYSDEQSILDENSGTLFVFKFQSSTGVIFITLKSKKDENLKFFIDINERPRENVEYFLAFSSEFEYEIDIDCTAGEIFKYYFTFDSIESFSPNSEVLSVIKYIEELTENIDSPLSSVIYAADSEVLNPFPKTSYDINYYQSANHIFKKVVYAVYLINSRYESPLVGAEIVFPDFPKACYLTGPIGNSFTVWNPSKFPVLIWREKSGLGYPWIPFTTKGAIYIGPKETRLGINIIQPEIPAKDLLDNIRALNGEIDSSKYRHCYTLIMRGLKAQNLDFSWGTPSDYLLGLVEITKSFPNQQKHIIKELESIGLDNIYVDAFDMNQITILLNILGWSNFFEILQFLSKSRFVWKCACYYSLTLIDLDNVVISETEFDKVKKMMGDLLKDIILEYDLKITKQFLKFEEANESITPQIESIKLMLELVVIALLKSDDKKMQPIYTKMIDTLSTLEEVKFNFSRDTMISIAKRIPNYLEFILPNLSTSSFISDLEFEFDSSDEHKKVSLKYAECYLNIWFSDSPLSNEFHYFEKIVESVKQHPDSLFTIIKATQVQVIGYKHFSCLGKYLSLPQMQEIIMEKHNPQYHKLSEKFLKENTPLNRLYLKVLLRNLLRSSATFSAEPDGFMYKDLSDNRTSFNIGHIFKLLDIVGKNADDLKFILGDNPNLFQISLYNKLMEIVDEDLVVSFIKGRNISKSNAIPWFVKGEKDANSLKVFQIEYYIAYLKIPFNNSIGSIYNRIRQAYVSKNTEILEQVITHYVDTISICLDYRFRGDSFSTEMKKFCDNMMELAKKSSEYIIISGFRAMLNVLHEGCSEILENGYPRNLIPVPNMIEDVLLQLPINTKSARKRYIPPSTTDEPASKKQKVD